MLDYDFITILGPTAGGKTSFAAQLAYRLNAEVISADSRQVYKRMDIGTGKDLNDYVVNGVQIPFHLIDIVEPGSKYNVYEFQKDFCTVYANLQQKKTNIILCGGSGMYIEAVLKGYSLTAVPVNESLRIQLEQKSMDELTSLLFSYKRLHNTSDITNRKRLIRAIEIAVFEAENEIKKDVPKLNSLIIGVIYDRLTRRKRITERLRSRLSSGMVEEVKMLLDSGIAAEDLIYYGLEYKFITQYLTGVINYETMFEQLNIAIHQFAKRQMTWFRKMEKEGFVIHWLDGFLPMEEKIKQAMILIRE